MKIHLSKSMKYVLSVAAIAVVSTGILGCGSINADPGVSAPARLFAASEKATSLHRDRASGMMRTGERLAYKSLGK